MDTRGRVVAAAAEVMRTRGLARATTKEIAKTAGYSEATLYKHFRDKTDLFLAVLGERIPENPLSVLAELTPGQGTLRAALDQVARAALAFYDRTFPMAASLFSEPTLLAAHREALRERGTGPHLIGAELAKYLIAEQELGRVRPDADPHAAAALLLGACLQQAFLGHFADQPGGSAEQDTDTLVETLVNGLGAT